MLNKLGSRFRGNDDLVGDGEESWIPAFAGMTAMGDSGMTVVGAAGMSILCDTGMSFVRGAPARLMVEGFRLSG